MKKLFTGLILLMVSMAASAQLSNSWRADWRNGTNTAYISKFQQAKPTIDCMLIMTAVSASVKPGEPDCLTLGSAFVNSSGVINVPVTTGPQGPIGPQGPQGVAGNDGTNGTNGTDGANGVDGRSAYQVAVDNGFVGTESAWLASLVGPAGAAGATGATGATGAQGPTGAQGTQGPQGIQGVTGTPAPTFNFSTPSAKTVAASTAYQAADPTKAAIVTMTPSCTNATTILASSACTLQVRQSASSGLTCSTGTVLLTWTSTVNLGLVFTAGNGFPVDVKLPIGGYFIVCPTAGTFTLSAVEQSAG